MDLLAGDIGGTNTRLAILEDSKDTLEPLRTQVFPRRNYSGFEVVLEEFAGSHRQTGCRAHQKPTSGTTIH